ncbi:hypothetical protein QBC46DRAFT_396759 [Diplogelasinospora grovesii]|uniref:Uncharacterized protein n=1 Tax=Diplogelasinospora grovesii TaxID=303347 RepID=A0AAN6MYA2_9PEZI|nr:hypothetical protein QBC46DRAFT_396759 [Diplogelasinospora grovesii]
MAPMLQTLNNLEPLLEPTILEPTKTSLLLELRQATVTVAPTSTTSITAPTITVVSQGDGGNDPTSAQTLTGGAIAGIVIGSIAGFLLLVWILRSCTNLGAPKEQVPGNRGGAWYDGVRAERHPPRSRSRHSHRSSGGHGHSHSHSRRRSVSEVREVRPVAVIRGSSPRAPPYAYGRDERRRSRSRESRGSRY